MFATTIQLSVYCLFAIKYMILPNISAHNITWQLYWERNNFCLQQLERPSLVEVRKYGGRATTESKVLGASVFVIVLKSLNILARVPSLVE